MTSFRSSPRWRRACAVVVLALLAACSRGGDGASPAGPEKRELPPAPEPAVAPVPSTAPAGMVVALPGGGPEGVVADPVTGVVAVALREPSRLALVDAKTARVTKVVPVPGAARHLQLVGPGGPVLVPGEDTDVLSQVDLRTGEVGTTAKVGRQPHDAAAADGRVYVADELGGSASVVNGDGSLGPRIPGPVQPGGVAVSGGRVGVVDVRGAQLFVYDAAKAQPLAQLPSGDGPTHAVPDGTGGPGTGGIVVADTRGGALLFFRLGPEPRMERRVALSGSPYGMAFDATRRRLWVTLTATNQLVGFDLSATANPPTEPFVTLPTVRQPNSVAVDPVSGRVFVAGATDAALQVVDPR